MIKCLISPNKAGFVLKKIVKFTVIVNYKQDTKINDILFYSIVLLGVAKCIMCEFIAEAICLLMLVKFYNQNSILISRTCTVATSKTYLCIVSQTHTNISYSIPIKNTDHNILVNFLDIF